MQILGRTSLLSTRIDETCRIVTALDPDTEGAAMIGQVMQARPDIEPQIRSVVAQSDAGNEAMDRVLLALGVAFVRRVKDLPAQVGTLVGCINDPSTESAVRCALVSILAYVSQKRDFVPDDAPGGYGFVDDCAMLIAALMNMLDPVEANAERIEAYQETFTGLQSMLPESVNNDMQLAVQSLVLLVQAVRALPEEMAESLIQKILDDPEGVAPPQPAADLQMREKSPPELGHWSGGIYFEGDNVIVPGGPSLINGELFIPNS